MKFGLEDTIGPLMGASHAKLARMAGAKRMPGRAHPLSLPIPGSSARVLVRPYAHGGVLGKIRGRKFSSMARAFNELIVSARAESLGLPVPKMAGFTALKLRSGKWHLKAWILLIPEAKDLPSYFEENSPGEPGKTEIMSAVAKAVRKCHDAGLVHPDLNCRNVIITTNRDRYLAHLVDLDKAHFVRRMHTSTRLGQLCRLYRSLAKERILPRILRPDDFARFTRIYFAGSLKESHLRMFMARCRRAVFWHSLTWKKRRSSTA